MVAAEWWQARRAQWLEQRLPAGREITLNQRRIFIVPSRTALALLLIIALLFLLGINFQNSLVYAVSFWLLALLLINIFHTYRNLSGLSIRAVSIAPCFAGEKAVLEIELSGTRPAGRLALHLGWPQEDETSVNLLDSSSVRVRLSHAATRRGYFRPPSLRVSTRYPTGLAVAWSYVTLEIRGLVYPRPLDKQLALQGRAQTEQNEDGLEIANGNSDFGGIRAYRQGDSLRQIHWSKYAQTGQLYTKSFVDHGSHDVWLDWDQLPLPGIEMRLSYLCSKVLELHQAQQVYGLKLPGRVIQPDKGEAQRLRCLQALALYGIHDE
ncbi:MAG: DUF58 domain-containing protein [Thiolinea sp.]